MKLFLGVDGGQSSTTALIGDESGRVISMGRSGPVNHVAASEGRAKFLNALGGAVSEALISAGLSQAVFESVCCGFSGGPDDKDALTREVVQSRNYLLTNDAYIALQGATAGEPGIVVIAGTGSIAFGRNAAGKTARAGGWGYLFGDEGGAFDLVRQALRAALRHEENWNKDTQTALHAALLKATGAKSANELLHWFYTPEYPRSRIAALAPLVDEISGSGDRVAYEVVAASSLALSVLAATVRRNLFHDLEPAKVSYIGGMFRSDRRVMRFSLLVEMEQGNQVIAPRYGPAAGALLEAYRLAGVHCELKDVPEEK